MLNLILSGVRRTGPSGYNPYEYDMQCEKVLVRLGPYDNSDYYEIRFLEDSNEIAIIHNGECLHSCIMEPV